MTKRAPTNPGTLYLVATPIGSLEDITLRALRVLAEVDLIAAEDTRSARVLLSHHGISTPTVSLYKDNEARRSAGIVRRLQHGEAVALISEAGMPGVSDPGQLLVQRCLEQQVVVDVVPGASAVLAALVLSGLPADQFTFIGFLPRRAGRRQAEMQRMLEHDRTMVLFESPRRVARTLQQLHELLGGRPAALVRELTKLHQQVRRGTLGELAQGAQQDPPRGEITLVVGGGEAGEQPDEQEVQLEVRARLERGQSPRQIAYELSSLGRRRIYQLALRLRE